MAEKEEVPYIVSPAHYDPELEAIVSEYMSKVVPLPKVTKKYVRTVPPRFNNEYERDVWEREEIRRCRVGYDGLPGKFYFYYNYVFIQKIKGGRIRPEFRAADLEWFKFIEETQKNVGWGVVCIKRRRVGASWKEAADMLHDIIFNPHTHVGMNSKSEVDSVELFRKVKFVFDNIPSFLRPRVASKAADFLELGITYTDPEGNKRTKGHQSYIVAKAPTISAFEGFMLNKWICDEAGKIGPTLLQMFAFTEDTMMDEYQRTGMPVIFGTVGEIDSKGGGMLELWDNAEAYKLKRFFFKGWMGLFVDSYGNDRIEESIRYIVYERKNQEKRGKKFYNDFLQRYPLDEEEAFALSTDGGLGDPAKINKQVAQLRTDPPVVKTGWYDYQHLVQKGEILFKPDKKGQVHMWEDPEPLVDAYPAGADPATANPEVQAGASLLSFMIRRKPIGTRPATTVLEITYRPKDVSEFYEQVVCALVHYNTKVLIENNRFDMISWFNRTGFKHLILPAPVGMTRITGGRRTVLGVRMDEKTKTYMEGLIEAELEHNTENIPSVPLLRELSVYGSRNTDRVFSWGLALMQEAEMIKPARLASSADMFKGLTLQKTSDGRLVRAKTFKSTATENLAQHLRDRGAGAYVID